jgi:thiol-disulfide isomerase/thioredoxin
LAKSQSKALFVDAWAPWCHTCLSMQHYVLNQPALQAFEARVVFAAIDTDRQENAAFLERHEVAAWPTFFMLDPVSDRVIGYWPGAASLAEMRGFVQDSLTVLDALREGVVESDGVLALFLSAKAAQADGQYARAATLYERVIERAPRDFRRRSEALSGFIEALFRLGKAEPCVRIGLQHLNEIEGAARPTDYTRLVFECTKGLPDAARARPRRVLLDKLRDLAAHPLPSMSPDDRADTFAQLADALLETGDREGARHAEEQRLVILERAAAAAPSPEAAATYDYGRAGAYLALGRAEKAVAMLQEREKQLPNSYEPPARLASILAELGRWREALAAIERALPQAYGARRLRYLALKAHIQQKLGDRKGALGTLAEEVQGHVALKRDEHDAALRDAKRRLARARNEAR